MYYSENELHLKIVRSIFRIHNMLIRHGSSDRLAGAFGLSQQQWSLLSVLADAPDGMKMTDLGKLLMVTKANMTGMIDRLERDGYVKRVPDPNDRRVTYVVLLEKGRAFLADIKKPKEDFMHEVFSSFSTDEKIQFHHMLERMFRTLDEL
ncbi:MarR family transcriptional regulator [Collibacillus ludicampi]|jgi:DNA-binding MarR family transcriptional regulator|uniref:MarR family transcriptional regulator n=1 Tax=Collibacillus ludicampi TaxID=2771369 RepID=A0AAV4LG54_9BACL|nr:MarR family transcriptional regulator [Collibacillus ludicampi]GIM46799.1 MarR family transcriptional regulator [Collibacillus ludicampi]